MKSPAFQFYPGDFLSDPNTLVMTTDEIGAYCLLFFVNWDTPLPNDLQELADLARLPLERFEPMWNRRIKRCFEHDEKRDVFIHPRLAKELKKQKEFRKKKQEAGIESGRKRREYKAITAEQVFDSVRTKDEQTRTLHSSSSSSSSKEKKDANASSPLADVREVFEYWQTKLDKPNHSLTTSRQTKIRARLKEFSVADLKKAIDAAAADSFLCGANDRGKEFTDFKTIFKTQDKVEELLYEKAKPSGTTINIVKSGRETCTQFNDFTNVVLPEIPFGGHDGDLPN